MSEHNLIYDDSIVDLEDDRPIAVRRKRRICSSPTASKPSQPISRAPINHGMETPPATPQRSKKRVRFSNPGPAILSTGLTPFVSRTSISSPSSGRRRHSTSSPLWNLSIDNTSLSGTLQFAPLRQVLEGRVKRRLRRNHMSEEFNTIEQEKRQENRARTREIEALKEELRQKDRELEYMRDGQDIASQIGDEATPPVLNPSHSILVCDLEAQIYALKTELQKREADATRDDPNWTLDVQNPFNDNDDPFMMPSYDDDFNEDMTDILLSTPIRRSFPSPPVSMPNTPSKAPSLFDAGVQVSSPDSEKRQLASQLETLREELKILSATVEITNTSHERLAAKLSSCIEQEGSDDEDTSLDAALDSVLTQLALSQSAVVESTTRFSTLSTEISTLGFQSPSPDKTIQILHAQFRKARLDLEYLNPGELTEGFENSKLLEMLVARLRTLTERVKQQDSDIDQYHEQEVSLRKQLGARIDATNQLHEALSTTKAQISTISSELDERDASVSKLNRALEGYRIEVQGLELLITRLEDGHRSSTATLRSEIELARNEGEEKVVDEVLRYDTLQATCEGQDMIISELENRLNAAIGAVQAVRAQMDSQNTSAEQTIHNLRSHAQDREKEHGHALALRDAAVLELRGELDRVTTALKDAHVQIMSLRRENGSLSAQVEGEKKRGTIIIEAMKAQLVGALAVGTGYLSGDVSVRAHGENASSATIAGESDRQKSVVRSGRYLDARLARRGSGSVVGKGRKRRRYDSGMGFLEEEDEEEIAVLV